MGTTAIKPLAIILGRKFMVQKNPNLANAMTDGHMQPRQHTFTGLFHHLHPGLRTGVQGEHSLWPHSLPSYLPGAHLRKCTIWF